MISKYVVFGVLLCTWGYAQVGLADTSLNYPESVSLSQPDLQIVSELLRNAPSGDFSQPEYLRLMEKRALSPSEKRLKEDFARLRIQTAQFLETFSYERSPSDSELQKIQSVLENELMIERSRMQVLGQILMELGARYFYRQECTRFKKAIMVWDTISPIHYDRRSKEYTLTDRIAIDVDGAVLITKYWYINLKLAGHPCSKELSESWRSFMRVSRRPDRIYDWEISDPYGQMLRNKFVTREDYEKHRKRFESLYRGKWRYFSVNRSGLLDLLPPPDAHPYFADRFKGGAIKFETQMRGLIDLDKSYR